MGILSNDDEKEKPKSRFSRFMEARRGDIDRYKANAPVREQAKQERYDRDIRLEEKKAKLEEVRSRVTQTRIKSKNLQIDSKLKGINLYEKRQKAMGSFGGMGTSSARMTPSLSSMPMPTLSGLQSMNKPPVARKAKKRKKLKKVKYIMVR